MFRVDAGMGADALWRRAAPVAPAGAQGGFSALYRQTYNEVVETIRDGFAGSSPAVALSPEGAWLRRRSEIEPAERLALVSGLAEPDGARADFVERLLPHAREAASRLGVAPELVVAHAALESGWGRRPLSHADGRDSHNLFGIKAGTGWKGEVVEVLTTEHEAGVDVKRRERFRAYPDPAAAFADYAQLLAGNPRYREALGVGGDATAFARALADGGYATDPQYALKLARVARTMLAAD